MALVKVKLTGPVDQKGARIDDKVLTFDAQGEASRETPPGTHFLTFFVIAPPGTPGCKIAITDPPSAKWERDLPIPANGVNGGFKKFVI